VPDGRGAGAADRTAAAGSGDCGRLSDEVRAVEPDPSTKPWGEDTERNVYWQNLDHVVAAEHAGFSHFWLTEQHFFAEIGHSACPEMFLAALSQRTTTIRLGFAVILMPCHNPFMIAERVATLDVQSPITKRMMTERG
jgi:hypothetical protein